MKEPTLVEVLIMYVEHLETNNQRLANRMRHAGISTAFPNMTTRWDRYHIDKREAGSGK